MLPLLVLSTTLNSIVDSSGDESRGEETGFGLFKATLNCVSPDRTVAGRCTTPVYGAKLNGNPLPCSSVNRI